MLGGWLRPVNFDVTITIGVLLVGGRDGFDSMKVQGCRLSLE